MSEYKDWGEYRDDWIKKMNNKDYYWREQEILAGKNHLKDKKGGNKILKMKTFFNDIAHHLVNNGDEQLAKDIFDRLWLNPQALPDVSESNPKTIDRIQYGMIMSKYMPTMYDNSVIGQMMQEGAIHLIDLMVETGIVDKGMSFDSDRIDAANKLFNFAEVINLGYGNDSTLVFTKKELEDNLLTRDDIKDYLPYVQLALLKKGGKIELNPDDNALKRLPSPDIVKAFQRQLADQDGTLWQAWRRTSDGEGMEMVVRGGVPYKTASKSYSKYTIQEPNERGDGFKGRRNAQIPMEDFFGSIRDAKSNHFFDAHNDPFEIRDLKDKLKEWYHDLGELRDEKGRKKGEKDFDSNTATMKFNPNTQYFFGKYSIPNWWIEFGDPRVFEYEQIVKPFYEKYGPEGLNYSNEQMEEKWDEWMNEKTWTFMERHGDDIFGKLHEGIQGVVAPPQHHITARGGFYSSF